MRFNRLLIVSLLFMIGFLMHAYDARAYCCVDYLGEICTDDPIGGCNPPSVTFQESCNALQYSQCSDGCCCLPTGGGTLTWNQTCQNGGGTFHPGPTTLAECNNNICSGVPPITYTLRGFVKNETNNAVNNVTVTVNRNIPGVQTNSLGYYTFSGLEPGLLTVSAQKGDCSAQETIDPFNSNIEKNLTLSCCQYQCEFGQCINGYRNRTCYAVDPNICEIDEYTEFNIACAVDLCEWDCTGWTPPFSDPNNPDPLEPCPPPYTQRTRECEPIIVGDCEVGPTPDLIMECGTTLSTCGNGQRESGEQCDFLQVPPFTGESNCPEGRRTFEWCTPECTCREPVPITDCNVNSPEFPTGIDVDPVSGQRKINVSWDLTTTCSNYVDSYRVFGCRNVSGTCSFNNVSNFLPKNVDEFMVLNSTWFRLYARADYCFKLETTFNNSIPGNKRFNSTPSCMKMGDDICLGPHELSWCGEWYGSSAILYCDSNNFIQNTTCQPGKYCGVNAAGQPECMSISKCDRCNGLFGIFGYQGFEVTLFGGETLDCPTLENRGGQAGTENTGCFLDYSYTSVDKVYNCTGVTSCYDYKSRLSCESDYCGAFQANNFDNKCEWADYNMIFNRGVCRPKKEYVDQGPAVAVQNCSLCNDPYYNMIYGDCTIDTCGLYGYCYFKKSTGDCIDGYSVSCADYETEEDCTGGINVSVDTIWNPARNQKIGRTNIVLQDSNDALGILRCEWNGTKCFRNADNLSNSPNSTDCRMTGANNLTICERDINPPFTTVSPKSTPHYGEFMDLRDAIFTLDDNAWPFGDNYSDTPQNRKHIWIYYSVWDDFRYPNRILRVNSPIEEQNYLINVLDQIPDGLEETGQQLRFFYFAEDPARNLEVVKNFSFILDITQPAVTLTTRVESYQGEFAWGDWATDLFVNITLSQEISMPVECFYNITPLFNKTAYWKPSHDESQIPSATPPHYNLIETVPGNLSTTYFELWPDRYYYEFKCIDDAGNFRRENGTFVLDGDLTISNPSPMDATYRTETLPHNISIHTTADGVCRYSRITTNYDDMEGTYIKRTIAQGDYLHYSPMADVFADELENEGTIPSSVYKIYTACDLIINGQHVIIVGGVPDIIRFAVDDLPPVTRLYYDPSNGGGGQLENFTNNHTRDILHLYLDNDDYSPLLDDGIDMSFKANSTRYCINTTAGVCDYISYDLTVTQTPIILDYTETGEGTDYNTYGPHPEFCYYSMDNGMNSEVERCIRLRLSNLLFQEPYINITAT